MLAENKLSFRGTMQPSQSSQFDAGWYEAVGSLDKFDTYGVWGQILIPPIVDAKTGELLAKGLMKF